MNYILELTKKLNKMLSENERAKEIYDKMNIPAYVDGPEEYHKAIEKLSVKYQEIYYKSGMLYTRAEIHRVRLELNKELIRLGF